MADKLKRCEDTIDWEDGKTDLERPFKKSPSKVRQYTGNRKDKVRFWSWCNSIGAHFRHMVGDKTSLTVADLITREKLLENFKAGYSKSRVVRGLMKKVNKYEQRS